MGNVEKDLAGEIGVILHQVPKLGGRNNTHRALADAHHRRGTRLVINEGHLTDDPTGATFGQLFAVEGVDPNLALKHYHHISCPIKLADERTSSIIVFQGRQLGDSFNLLGAKPVEQVIVSQRFL